MSAARGRRPGQVLLLSALRTRRRTWPPLLMWSAVEVAPPLVSGIAVAGATDRFLRGDVPGAFQMLALLLAAALVAALATHRLFPHLADLVEPCRDAFVAAVVEGALHAAVAAGRPADTRVVARLTRQVDVVRNLLAALVRTARQLAITLVAVLVGLAALAPPIALLTGFLVLSALLVYARLLRSAAVRSWECAVAEEELTRRAGEVFDGVRDLAGLGADQRAVADVGAAVDAEAARSRAVVRCDALGEAVVFVAARLPVVALLVLTPALLAEGRLTAGGVAGAVTYFVGYLEPGLRTLVEAVGSWVVQLGTALDRIGCDLVDPAADSGDAPGADPGPEPVRRPARAELRVDGLTFGYGVDPVLRDLDLVVPPGCHLAVVGPSGIGKSTLAFLLAGLAAPQRGSVRLGGSPICRVPHADLRRLVAVIPQEAYVFAGTLRENLAYLAADADDAALIASASAVGLDGVLDRLGGLDATVGAGGVELSSGEQQLVALARVHCSPAQIVLLDEATAHLDPATEARAEGAFAERPGTTLIVIAHRISSARRADCILVLDAPRAQFGTHDELLTGSAGYADLVGHWTPRPADEPRDAISLRSLVIGYPAAS